MVGLHGDAELQADLGLAASQAQTAPYRVRHVQANHRKTGQIGQGGLPLLAQRPGQHALGCHTNHAAFGQRLLGQRRVHQRTEKKTDIGLLQHQRRHNLGRMQGLHAQGHRRMLQAKQLDGLRQDFIAQCQHRQHPQFAGAFAPFKVARQALHFIELRKQPLDVRVQRERLRGGRQPAFVALKKRKTELQFGMLQKPADCRLADVNQARSARDAAGEHHGIENFDMAQTHGSGLQK